MQKLKKNNLLIFFHFFIWSCYFTYFWINCLWFDQNGNLMAGQINIWGDWAAHFTMGSALAFRNNVFESGPLMIGTAFSYPFFANLISALLIKIGIPFFISFILPSWFFSLLTIYALFLFYYTIFKSRKIALLASNFFLLNGGIGFYYFFQKIFLSNQPLELLINPIFQATRIDDLGIKFINVIDSMIIPQRAFNLGFPLVLIALSLLYSNFFSVSKINTNKIKGLVLSGVLIGLLPIIHTHSFLVTAIILSFWSMFLVLLPIKLPKKNFLKQLLKLNQFKSKDEIKKILNHFHPIIIVLFSILLIATPLIYKFFFFHVGNSFFKFYPGWLAQEYDLNWFVFWWRNWTVVPLAAFIGWAVMIKKNKNFRLKWLLTFSPFFVLFIVANLMLFQPFAWDNTKILIYSSLGFAGLNAWLINFLWNKVNDLQISQQSKKNIAAKKLILDSLILARIIKKYSTLENIILFWKKLSLKTIIIILIILFTFSGGIDAYYQLQTVSHANAMYTKEELELAKWVNNNTDPQSIWLTGDKHNHWLFNLTGRQAVMTYPGWLWTHGYDYHQTYIDVRLMYQKPNNARQIFEKYRVDYIVIGQQELLDLKAQPQLFPQFIKEIYQTKNYKIYQINQ